MGICSSTPELLASGSLDSAKDSQNPQVQNRRPRSRKSSIVRQASTKIEITMVRHFEARAPATELASKGSSDQFSINQPSRFHSVESARCAIFPLSRSMHPEFRAPQHAMTPQDEAFISSCLKQNFLFNHLGKMEIMMLVDAFDIHRVSKGRAIIRQGEMGEYFYIVSEGCVKFHSDNENIGSLDSHKGAESLGTVNVGGSFGELALLYDAPRTVTAIALKACVLWRVDRRTFRQILASNALKRDHEVGEALRRLSFLRNLDEHLLKMLVEAATTYVCESGEEIVKKGEKGNVFYVVKTGSVKVTDIEIGQSRFDDQELGPGEYFGERGILTGEKRSANVTALEECNLLCLGQRDIKRILGDLTDVILRSTDARTLVSLARINTRIVVIPP